MATIFLLASGLVFAQNGSRGGVSDPTPAGPYRAVSEGFDDITAMPGWAMQNNSSPLGITNWFQGNPVTFNAHSGANNSYIGANFNNTTGSTGTISNWLVTPMLNFGGGDSISFWTRTVASSGWADRLQVRTSNTGNSPGSGATAVGDFTNLVLDINPTYVPANYPSVWTEYTPTSGFGGGTGYAAFRYFVEDAGPAGDNSNYIGIDSVTINDGLSVPTLSQWGMVGFLFVLVLSSLIIIRRRPQQA
jgi:hypothetical protein